MALQTRDPIKILRNMSNGNINYLFITADIYIYIYQCILNLTSKNNLSKTSKLIDFGWFSLVVYTIIIISSI